MSEAPLVAERKPYKEFEKPAEGHYLAVISEVEDLGMVTWPGFQGKPPRTNHEIRIWWQLDAKDSEGRVFRVPERAMTLSLDPKANLFAFIKKLYDKEPPTTFDVRKLVGTQRQVTIVRTTKKDDTGKVTAVYANVAAMLKPPANSPKLEIVPRPKKDEAKLAPVAPKSNAITEANPITDDDIPF